MTSSTIISIKQYYCNKQLLDPPPGQKKKLCFAVEIKDGFISHYNSLKKKYRYNLIPVFTLEREITLTDFRENFTNHCANLNFHFRGEPPKQKLFYK